jgi:membrane-associated protein
LDHEWRTARAEPLNNPEPDPDISLNNRLCTCSTVAPSRTLKCVDVLSVVAAPAVAYLLIAAFVAFDSILPVVPSEVLVVAAGALAASGDLVAGWAVAAAALGAFVGDQVVYRFGRHGLTGVLARNWLGRRVARSIGQVHRRFRAVSGVAIVAGRFMPFGRTLGAGAAGVAGVRPSKFTLLSAVGVLLWAAWLTGVGFVTGSRTGGPLWISVLSGIAIAMVVGVCIAVPRIRSRTQSSQLAVCSDVGESLAHGDP